MIMIDRRKYTRHSLSRPCKVYHEATGRYWPAVTWDCSSGGVLVALEATRELSPGDRVVVYIAWSSCGLLSKKDGLVAEVKRCLPRTDGRQMLGVQFAEEIAGFGLPAAAA